MPPLCNHQLLGMPTNQSILPTRIRTDPHWPGRKCHPLEHPVSHLFQSPTLAEKPIQMPPMFQERFAVSFLGESATQSYGTTVISSPQIRTTTTTTAWPWCPNHTIPTCDTRPFQISAFFFNPQGPWPSLKFHLRSIRALVDTLGAMAVVLVVVETPRPVTAVWGTNASARNVDTTKRQRKARNLEFNIMLSSMNVYVQRRNGKTCKYYSFFRMILMMWIIIIVKKPRRPDRLTCEARRHSVIWNDVWDLQWLIRLEIDELLTLVPNTSEVAQCCTTPNR